MNHNGNECVRLEDRDSESSFTSEGQSNRRLFPIVVDHTRSNRTKSSPTKKILDPQEPFLLMWNIIFLISCTIPLFLDPLFFYATAIDAKNLCISVDKKLQIAVCVYLRSFFDIVCVFHIVFQFRTGVHTPSSRVSGKDELTKDPKAIAKWYLSNNVIIDILSVLPLLRY
ncbi:UNVERIFIED_CONTAM: putative cyclic nucleotide-gated ion channel 8 [Sesamum radiatum]|uniref:Cyclic nucleotide-gated ion channel 8 n=1 Tax=Sesamum radiatum TaxID=300843 RepID=A0AAW2KSY2_SESRA